VAGGTTGARRSSAASGGGPTPWRGNTRCMRDRSWRRGSTGPWCTTFGASGGAAGRAHIPVASNLPYYALTLNLA
jgi:hypothetical protein